MDITTQYSIGATVYTLVLREVFTPAACDLCSSTGQVTLQDAQYVCPGCHGSKSSSGEKETVALSLVIERVHATKCVEQCQVRYTGFRSDGRQVTVLESALFATEAEALAAL